MGHKVHPTGIRLCVVKEHNSVWYAEKKTYAKNLLNDIQVREFLHRRLEKASVSRIVIERPAQNARITIHTARPGIVIGKKGEDVDKLRRELTAMMGVPVHVNIEEIRKPDLDAKLAAQSVANQLERRVMFRRALKRAVQNAMRQGAKGIRIQASGRLGGAEIARPNGTARVAYHCIRFVPTSTMRIMRPTPPPTASSVSRCGYSRVKSLVDLSRCGLKEAAQKKAQK